MKSNLLTLGLILIAFSCSQDIGQIKFSSDSRTDQLMHFNNAELSYNNAIASNTNEISAAKTIQSKFKGMKVLWRGGFFQKIKNKRTLIVPISPENDKYTTLADGSKYKLSDLTFLVVRGEQGNFEYEIVTKIPDLDYLQGRTDKFSGTILVEDINGKFLKGLSTNGSIAYELNRERIEGKGGKVSTEYCYIVDWYTCAGNNEYGWTCTWDYTESLCWSGDSSTEASPDGTYASIGEYAGGGGGGGGESPYDPNYYSSPASGPICPENIIWTLVGSGYTMQLNNYEIEVTSLDPPRQFSATFAENCVTVPGYVGTVAASIMFTEAVNRAVERVQEALNNHDIPPSPGAVKDYAKTLIKSYITMYAPGSTFSTGPCLGSVWENETYSILCQ